FFFQAEDGIRDFHVTGVQTCALPICSFENQQARSQQISSLFQAASSHASFRNSDNARKHRRRYSSPHYDAPPVSALHLVLIHHRSEERRVGKGSGSRSVQD